MKAMVLLNIATDASLANGTWGIVKDILLDPQEDIDPSNPPIIHLKFPPAAVLFEPSHGCDITLPNLPPGILPIFSSKMKFSLEAGNRIERHQIALTGGYTFTDIKLQGQTIDCVLIDLAKPSAVSLTAFNVYVALLRSCGRNTIRLLHDFEEKLFTVHPSNELKKEDTRLVTLEHLTIEQYNAGEFGNFKTNQHM